MSGNRIFGRWGYLKSFSVESNLVDATSWGDRFRTFIPGGPGLVTFEGVAPATNAVMDSLKKWMRQEIEFPVIDREWMCLYCASPNGIMKSDGTYRTHCTQCGAPRSFLLG